MNNLLIRVNSTYESGMGHFMRCLALGQKWQNEKGEVYFLINDNDNIKERILNENMKFIVTSNDSGDKEDQLFLLSNVDKYDISWVIVDGYVFKEDYFDFLRLNNLNFLIFDDDGGLTHYNSNLVLNQNLHGDKNWYLNKKESYTDLLIGTDYVLLRNEFLDYVGSKKTIKNQAKNILITLGGSDVNNYSLDIVDALNKCMANDLEVIVLVGANNIHEKEIQTFIDSIDLNVKILRNISNMPEIMQWADLTFSSGGTSVWELAFMGVPTIVGSTSHVEEVLLTGLNDEGLFKTIGKLDNLNKTELTAIFDELILNKDLREKMSFKAQKFIDGRGSQRVINFMN